MVRPIKPGDDLARAVALAIGDSIDRWRPVAGGFSSAGLWVIETTAGRRRFVKAANTDDTARFLRAEKAVYDQVEASFMPEVEAWVDDGEHPILILEDLSGSHWPPPWSDGDIDAVWSVCEAIAATSPPFGLNNEAQSSLAQSFWPTIAADPEPVATLGVTSAAWFQHAFPQLAAAESTAVVTGTGLVHADIRSDNLCIGDQVKVVDWNWAFIGNPMLDIVAWLPSLFLEGGPPPWDLLTGETGLVSRLAGFFLQHATRPRSPKVRADIRDFQRAQGKVALEWAARELGLPPPELPG
jgi:hypothetical protein